MGNISKRFSLFLGVILIVSNLLMVELAYAQSIPNLSIPDFTVKFVDRSYDVPITYETKTDPFSGKQVTTSSGGNHVTNKTIDVIIKNQKLTTELNGRVELYYSVRTKGYFADWSPEASNGYCFERVLASSSDYTVITLRIGRSDNDILMDYADVVIPNGGQEDFQVQAQVGYYYDYYDGHIFPIGREFKSLADSGWSNTQTKNIAEGIVSEFSSWIIPLIIAVMVSSAGLLVYRKKHMHGKGGGEVKAAKNRKIMRNENALEFSQAIKVKAVSMKRSIALIGIAMILFGALVSITSEIPKEDMLYDKSFVITPNAHYYQAFRFAPNVKLSINFEVKGGAVDFIVLNEQEFNDYEINPINTKYAGISSPSVTSVATTWKTPSNESQIFFVWNNNGFSDKAVDATFIIHKTTLSSRVTILSFFAFFTGIALLSFSVRGFTPECSRSVRAHIVGSYIFAVLGGLIGVLLGAMLLFRKDTADQLHGTERFYGKVIIAMGITAFLLYAIYGYFLQ